ncbi:MAG: hypothetical protein J0L87_01490 [Bacteroidetes bacterium]|nr:hypothetical protein [Bacteroidota bacterium]
MKTEEAKSKILEMLNSKDGFTVTAQEINYATKGKLPFVQIYSIMAGMIKAGTVKLNESEGKKSYTLISDGKNELLEKKKENDDSTETKSDSKKSTVVKINQGGRDLTKYKFLGKEYNKSRLALAIITQVAKDKRLSLKGALELFDPENNVIPPYGLIKPIAEAKKLSKERARFFLKPGEEVKLRDGVVAISNQFTKERIEKVISVARKLKYSIK